MNTRQCPFPDCKEMLPPEVFACRPHWFSIPKPMRDGVWGAFRLYLRGIPDSSTALARLLEVQAAAMDAALNKKGRFHGSDK